MANLDVTNTNVAGVLDKLRRGEWLIPRFQRDFVWSTDQVSALVQSIIEARPIGMVTLWEQSEDSALQLEPISIPDRDPATDRTTLRYFASVSEAPKKQFAVLDGRQRCTALAMAFGGFRASHGLYKFSGRYFLDVKEEDPRKRIKFLRDTDVRRRKLDADSSCVSEGLFPLASNQSAQEELFPQWMRYLQALQDTQYYSDGKLPSSDELTKRNRILQDAFQGINDTKLAVYTVSERYSLSEICEIFETLNTTGTKVSTVDLIHSWLYADTADDSEGPFLLRDWIDELGQKDGAIGWSSTGDRPELIAQFVTACHVALDQKPLPRSIGKGKPQPISSIKASDLLSTPAEHWKSIVANEDMLAAFLGDAQIAIAGGSFPWTVCPYPVSLAVYVGLRWHGHFDNDDTWSKQELDALFRAFFWRNALTRRYDQGFLTQIGTDLGMLKDWLRTRPKFRSSSQWAEKVEEQLFLALEWPLPSKEDLEDWLTDGDQGGAIQKALLLPMLAGARKDLVDTKLSLEYPNANQVELHHIFPKDWCRNNKTGALKKLLEEGDAKERDWINSVVNLMPLSRISNNLWKQKNPSQFLSERALEFERVRDLLKPLYIDREAFALLRKGDRGIGPFWRRRATLIADDLLSRTKVVL